MSEDKHNFIIPEVETDNDIDESDKKSNLILAEQVYPDRIYILPAISKPVFPDLMFPVVLPPGIDADLLRKVAKDTPEQILGFVLPKEEMIEEEGDFSKEEDTDDSPRKLKLYRVGTVARIIRFQETEEGAVQVLLQGKKRFEISKIVERDKMLLAQVTYPEDIIDKEDKEEQVELKARGLAIMNTMRNIIKHNPLFSEEIKMFLTRADWGEPGGLADFCVTMTSSTREELQDVLGCLDVKQRMEKVLYLLSKELDINQLKEKITDKIEEKISQQQRDYFLREQLKAIKQELGIEKDDKGEEINKFLKRIEKLKLNDEAKKCIDEELDKLRLLSDQSPEFAVSRNYLSWLTELPWGIFSKDKMDVSKARRILNRDHHGLQDVKKRILEFIAVSNLKGEVEGSILCFVGPPGVGKTSLGKSIAKALGRKFFRFSLGGMRDEAEIKGHRRTYIGAMPGKFMQAMKNVKTANPVIMLDELDKVGASYHGDPASALLEVLDPEQNNSFRDHYLDVPFDLSKVLFIATANVLDTIPAPLQDRMEIIRLSGYILQEKLKIAQKHLIPKLLPKNGLTKEQVKITTPALKTLIADYAREAGVRSLEKSISNCLRKVAVSLVESGENELVTVTPKKVTELIGKAIFNDDPLMKRRMPGVVMGLAWTAYGGSTLYIEAIAIPDEKPSLKLTGQLGEVMQESVQLAYSMTKANAKNFGIDADFFKKHAIHLHVPAGATPKDGPSAGVTMATALISLATNKKLPARVAMTGELTLTGRVLPVGGIKEKIIAAKRSKAKHVIMPKINEKDFEEIDEKIHKGIIPHFVETYHELYELIFNGGINDKGAS